MGEIRVVVPDMLERHLEGLVRAGGFSSKAELARAAIISMSREFSTTFGAYDQANVLSPEGRIFQMQYAEAAVSRGAPVVCVKCGDGILFATPATIHKKGGVGSEPSRKLHRLNQRLVIGTAGIIVDQLAMLRTAKRVLGRLEEDGLDPREREAVDGVIDGLAELVFEKSSSLQTRPLAAACIIGWVGNKDDMVFTVGGYGVCNEYERSSAIGEITTEQLARLEGIALEGPSSEDARGQTADLLGKQVEEMHFEQINHPE